MISTQKARQGRECRARLPPHAEHVRKCLRLHGIEGPAMEDLCQEVLFLAFRRKIASLARISEIARRYAANYRRLYRHKFEVLDVAALEEAAVEPMEPRLHADVLRTLDALDPGDAHLLVLHALEGLSLAEIAEHLGLAKSAAHVRLERARRRFMEKLG